MNDENPRLKIDIVAFSNLYYFKAQTEVETLINSNITFEDLASLTTILANHLDPAQVYTGEVNPYSVETYGEFIWAYSTHIDSKDETELKNFVGLEDYFGNTLGSKLSVVDCLNDFSSRLKQEPDILDRFKVNQPYSMTKDL